MSISYQILENGRGFELIFDGVVKGQEIIESLNQLYKEVDLSRLDYKIINKGSCTEYQLTVEEMEKIASIDKEFFGNESDVDVAIIESHYLRFSLTELWTEHLKGHFRSITTLLDRAWVSGWLESKGKQA